jgi:hypothetical protein
VVAMVSNPNNTFYGEYSLYLVSKGLVLVILELIFGALLESGASPCTMLVTGLGVWSFPF